VPVIIIIVFILCGGPQREGNTYSRPNTYMVEIAATRIVSCSRPWEFWSLCSSLSLNN